MTRIEVSGSVPRFPQRDIAAFTRRVLAALARMRRLDFEVSDVSIAFVSDDEMKALNRRYRHKNRTTDVLTFPADESYATPGTEGRPLGDIVISIEQARRQAPAENHSLAVEIRYLILHGILHALGYDHEEDEGEMNEVELKLRAAVGLE